MKRRERDMLDLSAGLHWQLLHYRAQIEPCPNRVVAVRSIELVACRNSINGRLPVCLLTLFSFYVCNNQPSNERNAIDFNERHFQKRLSSLDLSVKQTWYTLARFHFNRPLIDCIDITQKTISNDFPFFC